MGTTNISTPKAPAAVGAYSQAIVTDASQTLFASGQIALDPATGRMVGDGDVSAECRQVLQNLAAVLEAGGMGFEHVVKATIFLVDMADFAAVNEIYADAMGNNRPARACVAVAGLPKGARVEIDAIAVRGPS